MAVLLLPLADQIYYCLINCSRRRACSGLVDKFGKKPAKVWLKSRIPDKSAKVWWNLHTQSQYTFVVVMQLCILHYRVKQTLLYCVPIGVCLKHLPCILPNIMLFLKCRLKYFLSIYELSLHNNTFEWRIFLWVVLILLHVFVRMKVRLNGLPGILKIMLTHLLLAVII